MFGRIALAQQAGDDAAFAVAKIGLAVGGEDFGDAGPRRRLDLVIRIEEFHPQSRRQPAPEAAFAHPHHADQHNRPIKPGHDIFGRNRAQSRRIGRLGVRIATNFGVRVFDVHCRYAYSFANRRRKHGFRVAGVGGRKLPDDRPDDRMARKIMLIRRDRRRPNQAIATWVFAVIVGAVVMALVLGMAWARGGPVPIREIAVSLPVTQVGG